MIEYSKVPNKRVGPNKRIVVGIFFFIYAGEKTWKWDIFSFVYVKNVEVGKEFSKGIRNVARLLGPQSK